MNCMNVNTLLNETLAVNLDMLKSGLSLWSIKHTTVKHPHHQAGRNVTATRFKLKTVRKSLSDYQIVDRNFQTFSRLLRPLSRCTRPPRLGKI